jgi:hypothetical protein
MYESAKEVASQLHPDTLRRMREVFAGETCAVCRAPAARLCGDQFFCHEHYPQSKPAPRTPRTYHCAVNA